MPRFVFFLDEIPKEATGKIQRIGMAERLGFSNLTQESIREYLPAKTPLEKKLVEIWSAVLGLDRVGIKDNYFLLGGNSISAAQIIARIDEALEIKKLEPVIFLHAPKQHLE